MRLRRSSSPVLLYILHSGNLYGTERMALSTLEGMSRYHTRVVVAPLPWSPASVAKAAVAAGFESIVFSNKLSLLRVLVPWFMRHRSIDVIGTGVVHSVLCHLLGRVFRVRVRQLHVAHGGTPTSFDRKAELNRVPVTVVAVSDFVRQQLIDRGVRSDAIVVIENFLSNEQRRGKLVRASYEAEGPCARPLLPTAVKVAIVSRVDRIKKLEILVMAVEMFGLTEFEMDVYGTGDDFDRLKARAAPLANLRFHGFVPDVPERLASADLLLHLCPEEPFGLAILEAFLAHLVAVVPDAGGAGSLIEDGITGLKFAADDPEDLCRVLRHAARLPADQLRKIADAGAATLETRFSQELGVRCYVDALERSTSTARNHFD